MGHISPPKKKLKMEDETFFDRICNDPEVVKVLIPLRKPYHKHLLPKSILHEHILKNSSSKLPIYRTEQVDKLFFTTLTLDDKQYANRYLYVIAHICFIATIKQLFYTAYYREKNKRSSEQAAALACLSYLKLLPPQNDPT